MRNNRILALKTDHLISARRLDLIEIIKKKITCKLVDFAEQADLWIKPKESEKKDKYLDISRELKTIEYEVYDLYQSGLVLLQQSPKYY